MFKALPTQTLEKEKSIDLVFTNEGVYALKIYLKKTKNFKIMKK